MKYSCFRLLLGLFLFNTAAFGQEKKSDTAAFKTTIEEVVVIGTRGGARIRTESPVPVDVIRVGDLIMNSGRMDLTANLNFAAPSFNFNKQSGTDGADHVNIGTLRGLGPDQTLVLINGKRRHSIGLVAIFGTRGRANSGVDLTSFPQIAVDRIEILRDGASAQYGSDAIAGVINLQLKKGASDWKIMTGVSGYLDNKFNTYQFRNNNDYLYKGPIDGVASTFTANKGFSLGNRGGFFNLSFEVVNQEKTFRQAASNDINDKYGLPLKNTIRQGFGDASSLSTGAFFNMELPGNKNGKFYAFGGINRKKSDAYAFTRNWKSSPNRFPRNADGSIIFVPDIMFRTGAGDTSFNPRIQTEIIDLSLAAGYSTISKKGWNWDISNAIGYNSFHYYGYKTFNASIIGDASKTSFDDGGFRFLQNTINIDASKQFGKENAGGLAVSYGAELRYENYSIQAGEEASYKAYPGVTGVTRQSPGAQGFPGFSPADVTNENRLVSGLYGDVTYTPNNKLLITGAVRFENYSDFGAVATFKTSARYKVTNNFNLRGSISTGYRAPSLQQKYFSNTVSAFANGVLVQNRVANNDDELTRLAGIPELKQETSLNGSFGFTWKPAPAWSVSVDGYNIKMKDRVVLSGQFTVTDPAISTALRNKMLDLDVVASQFFANAVNTTNRGLDVVVSYKKSFKKDQSLNLLFVGNFQTITIDKINVPTELQNSKYETDTYYTSRAKYFSGEIPSTFFNTREIYFMKASAPRSKYAISADYNWKKIMVGARVTYFGKVELTGFGDPDYDGIYPMVPVDDPTASPNAVNFNNGKYVPEIFAYTGKFTTDIYVNYQIIKSLSFIAGVDNLFNIHPNLAVNPQAKYWAGNNETGGPWDGVQMGYNGIRIFTRLQFRF
jgi:iron complex outermembrane receptor protein